MVAIVHNEDEHRFLASEEGHRSFLEYEVSEKVMRLTHTWVPKAVQGRGIAAELMAEALRFASAHGFTAEPVCSYAVAYMRRHPAGEKLDDAPETSS